MFELLIQIFLGWPAMILSLLFAVSGVLLKKPALSMTGAVLFLLPGWYLSHYSMFFFSLPLFLFASALSVSRNKLVLAGLFILPVFFLTGWLGYIVLSQ